MTDITSKPTLFNVSPVRITRDQDYRQFLLALLLVVATAVGLIWAYNEGILLQTYKNIGPWFTLGFIVLFVAGFISALTEVWWVSRGLNGLKSEKKLRAPELQSLFGISDFKSRDVGILHEEIVDELLLRMEKVRNPAMLALQLGLFGTVYGMTIALSAMEVQGIEDIITKFPEISGDLAVAFVTTGVGFAVNVVLMQMHWLLQVSSTRLKHRIFRTLHEEVQHANQEGTP